MTKRTVWRVYCDGREFGIDYATLDAARAAKRAYEPRFPRRRYTIRGAEL